MNSITKVEEPGCKIWPFLLPEIYLSHCCYESSIVPRSPPLLVFAFILQLGLLYLNFTSTEIGGEQMMISTRLNPTKTGRHKSCVEGRKREREQGEQM